MKNIYEMTLAELAKAFENLKVREERLNQDIQDQLNKSE